MILHVSLVANSKLHEISSLSIICTKCIFIFHSQIIYFMCVYVSVGLLKKKKKFFFFLFFFHPKHFFFLHDQLCLEIVSAKSTFYYLKTKSFFADYCDFCQCTFPDNVTNRRNHNEGTSHVNNRKLHYDWFKGSQ